MHGLRLVEISDRDKEDRNIYGMLQDIGREENGFGNEAYGLSFDQYRQFIEEKIRDKDEKTVRPGFAPVAFFPYIRFLSSASHTCPYVLRLPILSSAGYHR